MANDTYKMAHRDIQNSCDDQDQPPLMKVKSEDNHEKGLGSVVATHYNNIEEKGIIERNKSRIVYLRNFNNWIKSMLINQYITEFRDNFGKVTNVLDMGCGKGGDLLKWSKGSISHIICVDIADVSIEHCQNRYNSGSNRSGRDSQPFSAEFIVADCTKVLLKEKFKDKNIKLDIVSCQFSFHYCFESIEQADCMMRNVSDNLRTGGYFIGTIPDAYDIVARQKKSAASSFGNDIYKIDFLCDTTEKFPLFGAKYDFYLEGVVVNCPEFLVHFPTLIELAKRHKLKLVLKERFSDYFESKKSYGRDLLGRMKALETFPPFEGEKLQGDMEEYEHASSYLTNKDCKEKLGTLSSTNWEIASLYLVFAFQKE